MKVDDVVLTFPAGPKERWTMFKNTILAVKGAPFPKQVRVAVMAIRYSLSRNCQVCYYVREEKK